MLRKNNAVCICLLLAFICFSNQTNAARYSFKPRIMAGGEYSDNKFMRVENEISSASNTQQAKVSISAEDETSLLFFEPSMQRYEYDQIPELDSENYYLTTLARYEAETCGLSLQAKYSLDSTLSNEEEIYGFSSIQERRKTVEVSPESWFQWSERVKSSLAASSSGVRYPNVSDSSMTLVDYDMYSVSLLTSFSLNEKWSLNFRPYTTYFESGELIKNEFETLAVVVGGTYAVSETTLLSMNIGQSETKLHRELMNVEIYDSIEKGSVYELNINRKSERSTLNLSFTNDLSPTAAGLIDRTDELKLQFSPVLSELSSMNILLSAWRYRTLGQLDDSNERDQFRVRTTFYRKLTQDLYLAVSYDHQRQRYLRVEESGSANTGIISIIYETEHFL